MPALTDEGRRVVDDLVQRHGFSHEATEQMVIAVLNGNGHMAQFSHPEFGGSGQWMRGGMIMLGDMFNNYLKGRVDSLCSEIAGVLQSRGGLLQSGSFQSQSQSGANSQRQDSGALRGESSLFVPDPSQNWWPKEFGQPNATGSQNQLHYAYFSTPRRLAVKTGNSIWVYDTQDHQIGGFSQQQSGSGSIAFSSQFGTVELSSLPIVMRDGQAVAASPVQAAGPVRMPAIEPEGAISTIPKSTVFDSNPIPPASPAAEADIFATIERLGDLKSKGLLTDDEFNEKKKELLARL
jgi:hypothetical protein